MGAVGEAHNHNIPSDNTDRTIRTYLEQGIFYVMIQTNVPDASAKLKALMNRPDSVDVLFANGSFTAPGGHPTALVRRNIANGASPVSKRTQPRRAPHRRENRYAGFHVASRSLRKQQKQHVGLLEVVDRQPFQRGTCDLEVVG